MIEVVLGSRCSMRRLYAVVLVALLLGSIIPTEYDNLSDEERKFSDSKQGEIDVPNWRIGDKWVYETGFDVANLIQQANVQASINTLSGDTEMEVTEILFMDIAGTQTLVYNITLEGEFTSGNSGATLEGTSGRLDIDYEGYDWIRVRDLAVVSTVFTLDVSFAPWNWGWLAQDLAILTFDTAYDPPREKYDFPIYKGDQFSTDHWSNTTVDGSSDYFDPSEFDTNEYTNTSYQVMNVDEEPKENGDEPDYQGCDSSSKIAEWNGTGTSTGFEWYCPEIRSYVWKQIDNSAGFTIDWILKTYQPVDSSQVSPSSSAGLRNMIIEVEPQFLAVLPNTVQDITATFMTSTASPQVNSNLQLRYELEQEIASLTTDSKGEIVHSLDVGPNQDDSSASDDWSSNGVIVWDPVNKIIGVKTIVVDLSVVGVDLIADTNSIIVQRTRDGEVTSLSKATGYNALPGDILSFSIPAKNKGVLTSPTSVIEVVTPSNETIRESVPQIGPFQEHRVNVNWTVPASAPIGTQSLSFTVDPDQTVTQDANRSNNNGALEIFIGSLPHLLVSVDDPMYTFEEITINASQSYDDDDDGDVQCKFVVEREPGLVENIDALDCVISYNWSDDGLWPVEVIVIDDELDQVSSVINVSVQNRAPWVNLSGADSVAVDSAITLDASDSGDLDTTSPEGQDVTISWPGSICSEGLTQDTCTITPMTEGDMIVTVVAVDDDGAETRVEKTIEVLNIAPSISSISYLNGGVSIEPDEDGYWHVNETEEITLTAKGVDSISDQDKLIIDWNLSNITDYSTSTIGSDSLVRAQWNKSGLHHISVRAIDDDQVSSMTSSAMVMVHNVPPTIEEITSPIVDFEDVPVEIVGIAYDNDELIECWDLDISVDSDGEEGLDCDIEGSSLYYIWTEEGDYEIAFHVQDDDGAVASENVTIRRVNVAPTADISVADSPLKIMQGEKLVFSASNSTDSDSDLIFLRYSWDSSSIDSDNDGEMLGDVDGEGKSITIQFSKPGKFEVILTVTDDDGLSDTFTYPIEVEARPDDGFFSSLDTGTSVTMGMAILVILLLVVFLFIRKEPAVVKENYAFHDPATSYNMMAETSAPSMPPMPEVNQGPPIPVGGIPVGWTMEQWQHYGQQYLDSMATPAQPVQQQEMYSQQPIQPQPVSHHTQPAQTEQNLSDLLDDLGL